MDRDTSLHLGCSSNAIANYLILHKNEGDIGFDGQHASRPRSHLHKLSSS